MRTATQCQRFAGGVALSARQQLHACNVSEVRSFRRVLPADANYLDFSTLRVINFFSMHLIEHHHWTIWWDSWIWWSQSLLTNDSHEDQSTRSHPPSPGSVGITWWSDDCSPRGYNHHNLPEQIRKCLENAIRARIITLLISRGTIGGQTRRDTDLEGSKLEKGNPISTEGRTWVLSQPSAMWPIIIPYNNLKINNQQNHRNYTNYWSNHYLLSATISTLSSHMTKRNNSSAISLKSAARSTDISSIFTLFFSH